MRGQGEKRRERKTGAKPGITVHREETDEDDVETENVMGDEIKN